MSGRGSKSRSVRVEKSRSPVAGEAAAKRIKQEVRAEFSAALREPALKEKVTAAWACQKALDHEAIVLDPVPFHHCVIPNFFQNEDFSKGLQKELLSLDFHEKCNDLYKFKQSDDLKNRGGPYIATLRICKFRLRSATKLLVFGCRALKPAVHNTQVRDTTVAFNKSSHGMDWVCNMRKVLFEEFRSWLSDVTKVELEPTIDLSCAKYEYTDALLCHDDELEGRRIAFILYLVPPWDKSDGGTLDLFSTDDNFQPLEIVKSVVPSWNSLTFFEVSPVSFHQVAEVVSKGKCRLSVSGWFHGPSVARPVRYVEPLLPRSPHLPLDHEILYDWINPVYLDMNSQAQIQEEFEHRSETLLKDFLKREKFQLVCEALKKGGLKWSSRGPPNKRYYDKVEEESLPDILKNCMELFRSEAFFLLLSNFTGLKLHFLAPEEDDNEKEREGEIASGRGFSKSTLGESSQEETGSQKFTEGYGSIPDNKVNRECDSSVPLCTGELRHWTKGCYTLVHDAETTEFSLDLLLFCGYEDWDVDCGGFTSYLAKDEDEELLLITPEMNCLALVYRDPESLKFVKYINHRCLKETTRDTEEPGFWDICFVYYE